jgi:hypothetical protein
MCEDVQRKLTASQEVTLLTHQLTHAQALHTGQQFSSRTSLDSDMARALETPQHSSMIPRSDFQLPVICPAMLYGQETTTPTLYN